MKDIKCPECATAMGLAEDLDDLERGEIITCDKCDETFEIVNVNPLQLRLLPEDEEETDEEEDEDEEA